MDIILPAFLLHPVSPCLAISDSKALVFWSCLFFFQDTQEKQSLSIDLI
ncbi:hypothetical protein [Desulfitobacterium chlororespirans]|nr:hypothetical protein [Desulfitobacterium chlororespirans]